MRRDYVELRKSFEHLYYFSRLRILCAVVASVKKYRQSALEHLVHPHGLGRIYVELLKIRVQLYAVESETYRLVDYLRYLVPAVGVERCKAYEAVGVLRYALCDK